MRVWAAALVAGVTVGACLPSSGSSEQILVSAASSLTDAFIDLETAFEDATEGYDVVLNFGASSLLREQLLGGAPVDVFASASADIMDEVASAGLLSGDPEVLALNRLQIALPAGNPGVVAGLGDMARSELVVGLCAEGVPCGNLARQVLEKAGVSPMIDTNEPSARALLVKLEANELDLGITYASDVAGSDSVDGLEIPDNVNVVARYPIAVMTNGSNPAGADEFMAFALSQQGREILISHGFAVP